ncbi:hypothetical protein [Paracoccus sp. (in: a-proteobacteria)]|uniref:hypothetical protein n=1 Tax=Paracoccus sp. TaxID=267 RepID=UPI00396CF4A0
MDGGNSSGQDAAQRYWSKLGELALPKDKARRRMIADGQNTAVSVEGYDLLRTRILAATSTRGWNRIGVTQARTGRAGPLTALNLALSEARRLSRRVVLVDLDIAHQPILNRLGAAGRQAEAVASDPDGALQLPGWRLSDQLALLTVAAAPAQAATLLLNETFQARLASSLSRLSPDITIFHLPAMLSGDAGLASLPMVQAVLLAVDGRSDRASDLRASEARIGEACPILGLFLLDAEV